jgi:hypothetical protein
VAAIVKQGAARLGFAPSTFAAHSLRSELVPTAVKRGVNLMKICDQTGHKSLEMLRVYSRDTERFADELAKHGLTPRMDQAYTQELADLPPPVA